jgi:hypothetical protein
VSTGTIQSNFASGGGGGTDSSLRTVEEKLASLSGYDRKWADHAMSRSTVDANGCWLWNGFLTRNGYAGTSYRSKNIRLHRQSFVVFKGPVPSGHDVCHTCDVRRCWNPDHTFSGPRQANHDDMWKKGRAWQQKDTCAHGHPWSENALYRVGTNKSTGKSGVWRHCKECYRLREQDPAYKAQRVEYRRNRRRAIRAGTWEKRA